MTMTADVRRWSDAERRTGSLTVLVVALLILGAGFALWWLQVAIVGTILWVLVGLVVLLLLYEVALLATARSAKAEGEHVAHAGPAATGAEAAVASSHGATMTGAWSGETAGAPPEAHATAEPQILTLKCGECGTVFDVTDTGARPLYHTCPGCGAEGVLRGESAAAPAPIAPEREAPARDAGAWAPGSETRAPPAAAPAAAPPKRLKLRCGACKNVFALDDTGERPLRHRCPSCGKLGEIR